MKMLKNIFFIFFEKIFGAGKKLSYEVQEHWISSWFLQRKVFLNVYIPSNYLKKKRLVYPVIFFNDGQDMEALKMEKTLNEMIQKRAIRPAIIVAIHAGNRMHEYGTVTIKDYKNRGHQSEAYQQFVMEELLSFMQNNFRISKKTNDHVFAGFSLGALSAMEIVWRHADYFGKVGAFSGSFWWRFRPFQESDPDADRVMHQIIAQSHYKKGMQFWLQTGTKDETDDRNNNGIIDAIDDTRDLIIELEKLGYQEGKDIQYVEVVDGEHNQKTWGEVMPTFLTWAIGR